MKLVARTIVIVITIVTFELGAPASADYQAGVDAYTNRDFRTAMAEWLPLAEAGDATAQNSVGALYDHGLGVDENDAEAARWYQLAADQNLPLAMRNLANMYAGGHGVPFDQAQAEQWYEKAASLGDPVAIKRLTGMSPNADQFAATAAAEPAPAVPAMTVPQQEEPQVEAPASQPEPVAESTASGSTPAPEAAPVGAVAPAPVPQAMAATQEAAASDEAPQYGDATASASTSRAAQPATTQQASMAQPPAVSADPSNWLIGMWQGPSLGCPPGGGMEFAPGETRSYYQGQIAATLRAKYAVAGDLVTVTTIGVDGVGHDYQYERTGPNTFAIRAIPPEMPKSLIGVEHRRCASAPLAAAAAPAAKAPAPQSTPSPAPAAQSAKVAEPAPQPAAPKAAAPQPQQKVAEPAAQPAAPKAAAPQPQQAAAQPAAPATSGPQAGWDAFSKGDYQGALAVWQPLAEQGDPKMQLLVGSIYDYGQGVPQDDAEALKWYERAAAQGSAKGQFQAGAVYARSAQVKDPVQAYKWLTIAARSLNDGPRDGITADQATTLRALVEGQMSEADIAKAKQEADAFKATSG